MAHSFFLQGIDSFLYNPLALYKTCLCILWEMSGLVGCILSLFFPLPNFPFSPPSIWRPQSKIRFTLQLHSSSVSDVLFLPVGVITKRVNRPCSSCQVGMNIWRVLEAEIFFSSEHHPRCWAVHRWVRDEVCYRDVSSADESERQVLSHLALKFALVILQYFLFFIRFMKIMMILKK